MAAREDQELGRSLSQLEVKLVVTRTTAVQTSGTKGTIIMGTTRQASHNYGDAQVTTHLVSSQVEKSLDGLGRLIFTFLRATLRIHGCSPKKPPANILRTGDQNLTSPSSLQARTFPVSTGRNVRHVMVLPFASLSLTAK
jgi:hypothetical protein